MNERVQRQSRIPRIRKHSRYNSRADGSGQRSDLREHGRRWDRRRSQSAEVAHRRSTASSLWRSRYCRFHILRKDE